MKIKRIHADTIRQGIRRVREEIGPEAVILSTRERDQGVEVIAAMDFDEDSLREQADRDDRRVSPSTRDRAAPAAESGASADFTEMLRRARQQSGIGESSGGRRQRIDVHVDDPLTEDDLNRGRAEPAPVTETRSVSERAERPEETAGRDDESVEAMRSELKVLRTLFENQLSMMEWQQQGKSHPGRTTLLRQLTEIGFGPDVCRQLANRVDEKLEPELALRQALHTVKRHLPVRKDDLLERGGVVALVGPTGVGKTTTVAKLAAQFALRHGRHKVALVSTDNVRIGAQDQLRNFARILGVTVQTANSAEELETVLADLSDKRLVLVDTAGVSQRDMRLAEQFTTLKGVGDRIRSYLVLSANTQLAALSATVKSYGGVEPSGCILTKTDDAASLGAALTVLLRHRLPVSFLGNGQRVPEDLMPADAGHLVQDALKLVEEYGQEVDDE
ncbi:flagellar biosynthesis protein FlhF, partial [Aquisalimonas sp.]